MNNKKKETFPQAVYSTLSLILIIMTCFFTLFTFLFRLVSVSGDSMYPTLNENDKIVTLGGFDTVYVNMPSKYAFVLEESNKEAEENGVLFAPLDIKKPTTVLENLDLVGGHMIGGSNRNVF